MILSLYLAKAFTSIHLCTIQTPPILRFFLPVLRRNVIESTYGIITEEGDEMYELIQLTENDYYIDCPAKIGVVKTGDDEAVLIDSGNDKDAGKKALRILESKGWKLKAIYNTHSHADHIGGNRYLQEKTGCRIFAKGMELMYTQRPVLEPTGLYGGLPYKELRNKFLMAKESEAEELTEEVIHEGMKILELPGHSFEMAGFLTKDGTAYIADSVSSEETLSKYGIGYMWNPEEAVKTLEYLKTVEAARFVPSHAEVTEDIRALADFNIEAIKAVKGKIAELCREPVTFERLLKGIFDEYGLSMNAGQYALIGSTLRNYLSCMKDGGDVEIIIEDNELLWKSV